MQMHIGSFLGMVERKLEAVGLSQLLCERDRLNAPDQSSHTLHHVHLYMTVDQEIPP